MKTIRNSKINYAIETSVNYEGHNSMTNLKMRFEKEDLLINKKEKENYFVILIIVYVMKKIIIYLVREYIREITYFQFRGKTVRIMEDTM